ncbi:MAG: CBS domain-containing protein [Nitrospirae bacterium]|nr:CBS domain-containing protein [Nitrospirota bacterium]
MSLEQFVDEDLEVQSQLRREEDRPAIEQAITEKAIRTLKPRTPVCVEVGARVEEAVAKMKDRNTGCVLVVDDGRLTGIFSERDVLLKIAATKLDQHRTRVETVMTRAPETLGLDDPIVFALNKMSVGGFRHVPIVDKDNRPVGVVSVKDIVNFIVDLFPRDILNLPPEPGKDLGFTAEGG